MARSFALLKFVLAQLAKEPRLCERPLAFDCRRRHTNYLGCLLDGQPTEKLCFHDPALPRIERRKLFERTVQRQKVQAAALRRYVAYVGHIELVLTAASL